MPNKTLSGRFLHIDEMFAFVSVDEEGEGICGFLNPADKVFMPLVGADVDRVESFKPIVQQIANSSGKEIRLVKFSTRTELEVITPDVKKAS